MLKFKGLPDDPAEFIVSRLDEFFRGLFSGSDTERNDDYFQIATALSHPIANIVIIRDPSNLPLVEKLARERALATFPTALCLLQSPTSELNATLKQTGYLDTEIMHSMAMDIAAMAKSETPAAFTLREVDGSKHDEWVDTMAAGYELPREFVDRIGPNSNGPRNSVPEEHYHYFIAYHQDQPVATSTLIIRQGIIGVYNISTRPESRGKGLGTFVTRESIARIALKGYQTAILQASEMGRSIYERIGFSSVGTFPFYFHSGADG